jgi:hypothetical protein
MHILYRLSYVLAYIWLHKNMISQAQIQSGQYLATCKRAERLDRFQAAAVQYGQANTTEM